MQSKLEPSPTASSSGEQIDLDEIERLARDLSERERLDDSIAGVDECYYDEYLAAFGADETLALIARLRTAESERCRLLKVLADNDLEPCGCATDAGLAEQSRRNRIEAERDALLSSVPTDDELCALEMAATFITADANDASSLDDEDCKAVNAALRALVARNTTEKT